MKKKISTFEGSVTEFATLKEIISTPDNWKAQHAFLGTHLEQVPSAEYLSTTAAQIITRCKVWMANWEAIQQGIAPELEEIRKKNLKEAAAKFVGYTDEQLAALFAEVKAQKGEGVAEA